MTEVGARRGDQPVALLERGLKCDPNLPDSALDASSPDGTTSPPPGPEPRRWDGDEMSTPLARAKRVGWVLIGLQLVVMVALSTVQYSRYALTTDFGAYSQAWWKIAHGNLDPTSTIFNAVFWKNDAEFLMWPL